MTNKRFAALVVAGWFAFAALGAFVGYGIDANISNVQVANYQIAPSDCTKTVLAGTANTGQFTLTLPAVTGFPSNCSVLIKNGDGGNGKILSGFPASLGSMLLPRQMVGVKIINGNWTPFYQPGRLRLNASIALYVNGDGTLTDPTAACGPTGNLNCNPGVDTNDCLTPTTACLTTQRAVNFIINQFDLNGFSATVYQAHGSSNNYAFVCTGGPVIGQSSFGIAGDSNAPTAVVMVATSAVAVVKDGCTVSISNAAMADNGNNNAATFVNTGTGNCGHVDLSNISFGALGVGTALTAAYCGSITLVGANAVTGSENAFANAASTGVIEIDGTVAGSAGITWITAAVVIQQGGVITGVQPLNSVSPPPTFSGFSGVSGKRFFASSLGSPDSYNLNALYPGSIDGVVDVTIGALGLQSGSGASSTLDYGTLGHPLCSGGAASAKNFWCTYAATGELIFSTLPGTPAIGTLANISDGKASNCGDSACTAFGTTVTAGAGALHLAVRWNGTNWTLVGK
jgi:hypothetical protein